MVHLTCMGVIYMINCLVRIGIDLDQAQHKISALRMSAMMSRGALSDRDLPLRGALKYFREAGLIR
jgi:hypothetical protein